MSRVISAGRLEGATSVSTVQEVLRRSGSGRNAALFTLDEVIDDLDELRRRLARLHAMSTRYSSVTFSKDVTGLVKMAGQRALVDSM